MYLINGRQQAFLAADDRAVQFGDGCFTTARIVDGNICLFAAHLARLQEGCSRLAIPFDRWDELRQEMSSLAAGQAHGVLKVILSRGSGGRGYATGGCGAPGRVLSVTARPDHYARWREQGVALALSPVRLGRNPLLAGIKHLNRLEQVLIRRHLEQTGADEALVLDSEGWVTECCAANLFWRKGNRVWTPRLDQAGVNGVMRQFCLRRLEQSPFQVMETQAREADFARADEAIVCNALMPVIPVRAYGERRFSSRALFNFLAPLCEHPNSL
ncbi:aminodeoxychorismate lyase [Intestinirhabdus alba]|jgi:4-amino-4-deoxychorismate lyase|uniref:Aminodeoxychorismate lyase n=1 Tax=Intestinirhabdus alba TaxID=2899544 RepID=A0A6L6IKW8_9ENTR|nr:aminodeoxychorismate lyase [Intestinirhabdus alba]MTH46537.1 aminodeoxychorismate lyase [Intestinirhabdus alba]